MPTSKHSRRRFLTGSIAGLFISSALAAEEKPAAASSAGTSRPASSVNIADFGTGQGNDAAAINQAIDYCVAHKLQHVRFPSGNYQLDSTLLLPSGLTYEAEGPVTLRMEKANAPIMESLSRTSGAPQGRTAIIGDFRLMGNPKNPDNHGVVLYDYYSRIDGLSAHNCGGNGIYLAEMNKAGVKPAGTLVENRIINCRITGCMKGGIRISTGSNSKLTDGLLQNIIISCSSGEPAIALYSAAGWIIQNVHIYGKTAPRQAISLSNAYFTTLDNIYIEGYTECAVDIAALQTSVSLHNICLKSGNSEENQPAIRIQSSSKSEAPAAFLSSISIFHRNGRKIRALQIAPNIIHTSPSLLISGPGKNLVDM